MVSHMSSIVPNYILDTPDGQSQQYAEMTCLRNTVKLDHAMALVQRPTGMDISVRDCLGLEVRKLQGAVLSPGTAPRGECKVFCPPLLLQAPFVAAAAPARVLVALCWVYVAFGAFLHPTQACEAWSTKARLPVELSTGWLTCVLASSRTFRSCELSATS